VLSGPALVAESVRVDDPGDLLELLPAGAEPATFLADPAHGVEIAAVGVAAEVRAEGAARFADAARAARALLARVERHGPGPGPILVGGFAFEHAAPRDPAWRAFPALRLVLPARLWMRRGGSTWAIRVRSAAPGDTDGAGSEDAAGATASTADDERGILPDRDRNAPALPDHDRLRWIDAAERAIADIRVGRLRKVVLARARRLPLGGDADATACAVVRHLRDGRPECLTFWVRRGGASFVGSSPELLARVDGGRIEAVALAGSARRPGARDADEAAARALLASAKNRAEHAFVAADVGAALAEVCTRVTAPVAPAVRAYPEAFHLATPFAGVLGPDAGVLEAVAALHPTSAVCGVPRAEALASIGALERCERGWYAGGVGWVGPAGAGTFAVALRAGLLRPGAATLYAGAGLVAHSEPAAEYDETEAKMSVMTAALTAASTATAAPPLPSTPRGVPTAAPESVPAAAPAPAARRAAPARPVGERPAAVVPAGATGEAPR